MKLNFSIDNRGMQYYISELDATYNRDDRVYWFEFEVYEKLPSRDKDLILSKLSSVFDIWFDEETFQQEDAIEDAKAEWCEYTKDVFTPYGQESILRLILEQDSENPQFSEEAIMTHIYENWGDYFHLSALNQIAFFSERDPRINLIEQRNSGMLHSIKKEVERYPASGVAELSFDNSKFDLLGEYVLKKDYYLVRISLQMPYSHSSVPESILSCYARGTQKKEKFANWLNDNNTNKYYYNLGGESHETPGLGMLRDQFTDENRNEKYKKIADEWSAYFSQIVSQEKKLNSFTPEQQSHLLEKIRAADIYSFETKLFLNSYDSFVTILNFLGNTELFTPSGEVKEGVEISHYFERNIKELIEAKPLVDTLNTYIGNARGRDHWYKYTGLNGNPREEGDTEADGEDSTNIPFVPQKAEIIIQNVEITNTFDYDNFFEGVATVTPSVSTSYKALFPPILESSQPAFLASSQEYEIFFQLSDYTNFEEVAHVDLRITLCSNGKSIVNEATWYDQIIYFPKNLIQKHDDQWYSVIIDRNRDLQHEHWQNETYYKIQARLGTSINGGVWESASSYIQWRNQQTKRGLFSDWSTAMILKAIPQPSLKFVNLLKSERPFFLPEQNNIALLNSSPLLVCEYKQNDLNLNFKGTEYLYKYRFFLYEITNNANKKLVDSTDWFTYTNAIDNENLSTFSYRFDTNLQENIDYRVVVEGMTVNNYNLIDYFDFQIETLDTSSLNENCNLFYNYDEENGAVMLEIELKEKENNENYNNSLIIIRQEVLNWEKESSGTIKYNCGPEQEMQYIWLELNSNDIANGKKIVYNDRTVECGKTYRYIAREQSLDGVRSMPFPFVNKKEPLKEHITTNFEHMFVFDGEKQLKLKFNPKLDNFKHTTLIQKQDTLGGKYPVIMKSGQAYYAEFSLGGLITLNDEDQYFYNSDIFPYSIHELKGLKRIQEKDKKFITNVDEDTITDIIIPRFSTNLTYDTINYERKFREDVEKFLNDNNYKLFRSPYEGNLVVAFSEVSLAGEPKLGRAIATMTSKVYEMAENNYKNLIKYNFIRPGNYVNYSDKLKHSYGQLEEVVNYNDNIITLINNKIKQENMDQNIFNENNNFIAQKILNYKTITITNYPYIPEQLNYRILEEKSKLSNSNLNLINKLTNIKEHILDDYYLQSPIFCKFKNQQITILPGQKYIFTNVNPEDILCIVNIDNARNILGKALLIEYSFEYYNTIQTTPNAVIGSWIYPEFGGFNGIFYNLQENENNELFPYGEKKYIFRQTNGYEYYRTQNINRLILEQIYNDLKDKYMNSTTDLNFSMEIKNTNINENTYIEIVENSIPKRKYKILLPDILKISFESDNYTLSKLKAALEQQNVYFPTSNLSNPGGFSNNLNIVSKLFVDMATEENPIQITQLHQDDSPCQMSIIYLAQILVQQREVE